MTFPPYIRARCLLFLFFAALLSTHLPLEATTLPENTVLPIKITRPLPMRVGEPVRGELIYPIYADNKVLLPAGTIILGTVLGLSSDHSRRVNARLNGDFTPYHVPIVHFSQLVLADGTSIPLTTAPATDGAPIIHLTAPAPGKSGGFIHKQWDTGLQILHSEIAVFTAPEKGDRLLQLFYHQLPYHPERIESGTAWTIETAEAVTLPDLPSPPPAPTQQGSAAAAHSAWILQAYLRDQLSSRTAKSGQTVHAIVAEPVYNSDHILVVPEGAMLVGAITRAKPARSFARSGSLGLDFSQVVLPDGETRNVQSTLTGTDAQSTANLAMDSEGRVAPKPQDKVMIPLLLALLATRPLDDDGGVSQLGKNFVGANGFGLAARILSIAGTSPNVAAGIGAYGTAVSIYRRWIAHGKDVTFARSTRVIVEATPRNAPVLMPNKK